MPRRALTSRSGELWAYGGYPGRKGKVAGGTMEPNRDLDHGGLYLPTSNDGARWSNGQAGKRGVDG